MAIEIANTKRESGLLYMIAICTMTDGIETHKTAGLRSQRSARARTFILMTRGKLLPNQPTHSQNLAERARGGGGEDHFIHYRMEN